MKYWLYFGVSLVACASLLSYTYFTRHQFYPAVIYLVTSKFSLIILANTALVLTTFAAYLLQKVFFRGLRDAEVELLHENVRYAVTDSCLALTIFREEINFVVGVLFVSMIFSKIFHWLTQSRIEFMEQSDVVTRGAHIRLVVLMSLLAIVDAAFVILCGKRVLEQGVSVFILFGFEFLVLLVTLVGLLLRYGLFVIDSRMEATWTNKFTYLFYLELISEVIKLIIYLVFFMLIFKFYGMPLHIVRDLWLSIKNLQRRIASFFRYRKIAANLNQQFPTPREDELNDNDKTCIICREEMTVVNARKLPCAHIFHIDCLRMWVQRQQTCPTCRSNIPSMSRPPPNTTTPNIPPRGPWERPQGAPEALHQNPVTNAAPIGSIPAHVPPFPPMIPPVMYPFGMYPPFGGFPYSGIQPGDGTNPFLNPMIPSIEEIQRQIDQFQMQLTALQDMSRQNGLHSGGNTHPESSSAPVSTSEERHIDPNLEDKAPVPPTAPPHNQDTSEAEEASTTSQYTETVLTERTESMNAAEKRREELRQRYNRIYSDSNNRNENEAH